MKTFQKVFKFRLELTKAQRQKIAQTAGCARFVYNRSLELYIKSAAEKVYLTYEELCKVLTILKRNPETEWLKEPPAQILQQAIKDAIRAIDSFYREKKKKKKHGFPKFRRKFVHDSFKYPQHVKTDGNLVWLPKVRCSAQNSSVMSDSLC
jgi:putative transposase